MRILFCATLIALFSGCNDTSVLNYNNAPNVVISSPFDGDEFEESEVVEFSGIVTDDSPLTDLSVQWKSSIDGVFEDVGPADPDGNTGFATASLSEGVHVITLTARDIEGEVGEATMSLEVIDVPDAPSIEVRHPAEDELALDGMPFVFLVKVDDHQDNPEDLTVELSSNPGGFICFMSIDGGGNGQCAATLAIGSYLLTFRAEDTDGNIAEALAEFKVVSPLDFDADGDGFTPNGGDCNDGNDTIYPGAPEICDGLDNDCNELTGIDVGSPCYDDDGDTFCEVPPCVNSTATLIDCDDTDPSISPLGMESLNGKDDDCDSIIDETTVVYDDDGDGYCESPPCLNTTATESDCNDNDYNIYPTAPEICSNAVDENCNGELNEEDAIGCTNFYYDGDGDTFGVAGSTQCWCDAGEYPYTGRNTTDCYDNNADVYPGQTEYFAANRGDGSFDFNCSSSEEKLYQGVTGGCSWDVVYLSCDIDGKGWDTSEPTCGGSGQYVDSCSATYDYVCYLFCLTKSDPFTCLISTCGATCDPDKDTRTQECR
jgi:hypothetical protein